MRKTTFVQQPMALGVALGLAVALAGCSTNSPTAPAAKPTPNAYSISLTASQISPQEYGLVARVTG